MKIKILIAAAVLSLLVSTQAQAQALALDAALSRAYTAGIEITVPPPLPEASGGTAPYVYTMTGLPDGLIFDESTRTYSGLPTTARVDTIVTYTVTDANDDSIAREFILDINPALLDFPVVAAVSLTVGVDYNIQLDAATGGTGHLMYTLTGPGGGTLPVGLIFAPDTRRLSGTLTEAVTAATATTLTYTVTDSASPAKSDDQTITVMINPAPNVPATGDVTISGTATPGQTLTAETGTIFDANGLGTFMYQWISEDDGDIADATASTFLQTEAQLNNEITVRVSFTDNDGYDEVLTSNSVTTVDAPPMISASASTVTATAGTAITDITITSTGGAVTNYGISPAIGNGLAFDAVTGTISGTPTAADEVIYTITASNPSGDDTATVAITVNAPVNSPAAERPLLTGGGAPGSIITADTRFIIDADGLGTFMYQWLQDGIAISGAMDSTFPLTETHIGTSISVEVRFTDDAGFNEGPLTSPALIVNPTLSLPDPADKTYTVGETVSFMLGEATGGSGSLSYTLTGDFPSGLSFNVNSRTLSGTPTTVATVVTLTYTVTDSALPPAIDTQTFTVTINPAPLVLPDRADLSLTVDNPVSFELPEATGGTGTLSYTLTGSLPTWLSFEASTRTLSGTPTTAAAAVSLTYKVTDSASSPAIAMHTFTVSAVDIAVTPTVLNEAQALAAAKTPATIDDTGKRITLPTSEEVYLNGVLPAAFTVTSTLDGVPTNHPVDEIQKGSIILVFSVALPSGVDITVTYDPALGTITDSDQNALGKFTLNLVRGAIAQETVDTINGFLRTRTTLILANQPNRGRRINRLQRGVGSEQLSYSTGDITKLKPFEFNFLSLGSGNYKVATSLDQVTRAAKNLQLMSGNAGIDGVTTHERRQFDVWFEGRLNKFDGAGSNGNFGIAYLGADYLVSPDLLLGALVQYDQLSDSSGSGDTIKGKGWMAGPYVTARLRDNLYFDGRLAWGTSDNDISLTDTNASTTKDSFKSERWLTDVSLSGEFKQGNWIIRPNVSLSYMEDRQKAYLNTVRVTVPGQTASQGQLRFGPNFSTRFLGKNAMVIEPSFTLDAIYSHAGSRGATPSNATGAQDGWRARFESGLAMTTTHGTRLAFTGNYDGIGQSGFESWGLGLNMDMKF